jgi:hypothetical protein
MRKIDYIVEIEKCFKKREQILINEQPMRIYNHYFDKMRKYARILIDENRQEELLPFLENESISIKSDAAGLLFHCYPQKCREILESIASNPDIPWHFAMVGMSAIDSLKYGIPENFP